jgi:hypothetical protein
MLRYLLRSSFGVVLLSGIYFGADNLSAPQKMHRVYHDNGNVSVECPLDSAGKFHGEMRTYHPSGRLQSVTDMRHGLMGTGASYRDERSDNELTD